MRLLMTLFAVFYFPLCFGIILGLKGFFLCLIVEAVALAVIALLAVPLIKEWEKRH